MTNALMAKRPHRFRAPAVFREWPTWMLVAAIYAGWFAFVAWFQSLAWWILLPAGAWFVAWHNSFQHEAVHRHPTRNDWVNGLLAGIPLGLWLPYPIYRDSHRTHHASTALTDPFEDPESWYVSPDGWRHTGILSRAILRLNNTLAGRMVIGPWLVASRLWKDHFLALQRGDLRYFTTWTLHAALILLLLGGVWKVFGVSPLEYVVFFAWPGLSLSLVRSFLEHRPAPEQSGRTVIVEAGPAMSLLFLNNNLHLLHHLRPNLPWFALPSVYRRNRAELLRRAEGFYFPQGYREIARRFAFRPKDRPVHPG